MVYKSGDIGFSSSNTFISKAIRFFTSWHTLSASKSHTYAYISDYSVVEALDKVRVEPSSKYNNQNVCVYRLPLSDMDRTNFYVGMLVQRNKAYGWFKIPLFALDGICTKIASLFGRKEPIFFFTRYFSITNFPVCSQLIVWGLHKFTSYRLKDAKGNVVPWRIVSPDYFLDLLKLPINNAMLILY